MPENLNGFLEALKKSSKEDFRSKKRMAEKDVLLIIDFDKDGNAFVRTADKNGKQCIPDSNSFTGPLKTLLRSIEQINKASQFYITWGEEYEDGVSLVDNRHLIYQLIDCPNICDRNLNPIIYDPEKQWTLTLRLQGSDNLSPEFVLQNDNETLASPKFLTGTFALAGSRIVKVESVGENFSSLKYFKDQFDESLLEKYLSILFSTLDNVKAVINGIRVVHDPQPIICRPTIVIEKVSEDKALYLNVMHSTSNMDPGFLRDFSPNRIAVRTADNVITVRPLEMEDINEAADKIQAKAVKYCPGGKTQAKEIFREDNSFIIPSHTAEPFLFNALPALATEFRILGAEKLKGYKIRPVSPKLSLKLGSGIDFLEADASIDLGGDTFTLADFLRRYRKDSYIVLSDGDRAIIDENYVHKLERLFSSKKGGTRVSFFDLPEVATMLEDIPKTGAMAKSRKFYEGFNEQQKKQLRLKDMKAELRPYQKEGVKWLQYLYANSMGGCLADDMGLGKTIQTIAMLTGIYHSRTGGHSTETQPALVVMPKSLLFNWKSEFERFAPQLDVYTYYGLQRDPSEIPNHQIILTSYGMVRSDIESLKDIRFQLVILDESQNIKNVSTHMTQAVLLLNARNRFALSGTPVENNLTELYSLFRFLNPAMFGTLQEFIERYAFPIHHDDNSEILAELRRKIYPFILRRTKSEVLDDLPERIDQKIYVDMEPQHASFYEQRRRYFYETVHEGIAQNGLAKSQFVILQALSELRRIASIPESMSDDSIKSSKIPVLMESLEEAVSNGHKAVVFFNFIAGIEMVGEMLDNSGIGYAVMTGATQDRQSVVKRFQFDENCRVLLMTLKTGGVGLNLTAADTVFIFEPWWNKAEEEQAIGRLHRIGQKNTVITFSMITKGTIEEKICQLQKQKSQLIDSIISSDGNMGKNLSEDDIDFILQ